MRTLLAFLLAFVLWVGVAAPKASADVAGLTPCGESPEFLARAEAATSESAQRRFELYANSGVLCGEDGLPHLIVDGRWSHAGEFLIPSILFLYIAGWIGWAGRTYLQTIKQQGKAEEKEIIIDVPLAVKCSLSGFAWPATAFKEISSGAMFARDGEVPISPR